VSLAGLLVASGLTLSLVTRAPIAHAAAAAAQAMLGTELLVTVAMLTLAWRRAWSAPLLRTAFGVAIALLAGLLVDSLIEPLGAGLLLRGTLLALTYSVTLPLVGAVQRADVDFLRTVLRRPTPDAH